MNHRRKWYKVVIKREHPRLEVMKCSPKNTTLQENNGSRTYMNQMKKKREKGKEMQKPSKK